MAEVNGGDPATSSALVVFFGPPGAGKTTLSSRLFERLKTNDFLGYDSAKLLHFDDEEGTVWMNEQVPGCGGVGSSNDDSTLEAALARDATLSQISSPSGDMDASVWRSRRHRSLEKVREFLRDAPGRVLCIVDDVLRLRSMRKEFVFAAEAAAAAGAKSIAVHLVLVYTKSVEQCMQRVGSRKDDPIVESAVPPVPDAILKTAFETIGAECKSWIELATKPGVMVEIPDGSLIKWEKARTSSCFCILNTAGVAETTFEALLRRLRRPQRTTSDFVKSQKQPQSGAKELHTNAEDLLDLLDTQLRRSVSEAVARHRDPATFAQDVEDWVLQRRAIAKEIKEKLKRIERQEEPDEPGRLIAFAVKSFYEFIEQNCGDRMLPPPTPVAQMPSHLCSRPPHTSTN